MIFLLRLLKLITNELVRRTDHKQFEKVHVDLRNAIIDLDDVFDDHDPNNLNT